MKKRILSILACILLMISMLPATVFAEENEMDEWDSMADTLWYTDGQTEFHLSTAEQLAGLAQLVNGGNTFVEKTIYLDNDLDLGEHEWNSIGTGNNAGKYFGGTFDGQGYEISNLTNSPSEWGRHGLFGVVSSGGELKNVRILNADISAESGDSSLIMGILADWANNASIINCSTEGTVKNSSGEKLLGGLVGQCTGGTRIIGCSSSAHVISKKSQECDTVGGLIGQWENSTENSLISDCWFDGTIDCEYDDAAVGGILGANFDFYGEPGVTIQNCLMATKDVTSTEPGNITWIAAVVEGAVKNCIWPDDSSDTAAVVKLVVDWAAGKAGADPDFDENECGFSVSDFQAGEVLDSLQSNNNHVTWVEGFTHPTFEWDEKNIPANYDAVDEAKKKVPGDGSIYTKESWEALQTILNSIDTEKSKAEQSEVDAYAEQIEDAIKALVEKPVLQEIKTPEAVAGLENGVEMTAEGLGLPDEITILTKEGEEKASVEWNLEGLDYDPNVLTEQTFTVTGTVTLPDTVVNTDEVELTVQITVTVSAAGVTAVPVFDLSGGSYKENQKVVLTSTTEGAVIYYTTDGSEPTEDSAKYEGPIVLEGIEGESVEITVKAIAVADGMQNSKVVSVTYVIDLSDDASEEPEKPEVPDKPVVKLEAQDGQAKPGEPVKITVSSMEVPDGVTIALGVRTPENPDRVIKIAEYDPENPWKVIEYTPKDGEGAYTFIIYDLESGEEYAALTVQAGKAGTSRQEPEEPECRHEYEWVPEKDATATENAQEVYQCKYCGRVKARMDVANSAYAKFNKDAVQTIDKAPLNGTITVSTPLWVSFHKSVIETLKARPDVTLVLNYRFKGERYTLTIPAGTDLDVLEESEGYYGFRYLDAIFAGRKID